MAGLIYHQVFTPREIDRLGEFQTKREVSETKLHLGSDHDGERERTVRLPLIKNPPSSLFHHGQELTVKIRLGNTLMRNKKGPLYVLISDGSSAAVGFKITGDAPINGVEGIPDRFLNITRVSGDDKETVSLSAYDYPDEFNITLKPEQYWGTIFCTQGNGTKQCVGYGKKPDFNQGVYLEFYREKPAEEYIINYVEVTIYSTALTSKGIIRNKGVSSVQKDSAIRTSLPEQYSIVKPQETEENQLRQYQVKNPEEKISLRSLIIQQLKDFKILEEGGVITSEEFQKEKTKLLNELSTFY